MQPEPGQRIGDPGPAVPDRRGARWGFWRPANVWHPPCHLPLRLVREQGGLPLENRTRRAAAEDGVVTSNGESRDDGSVTALEPEQPGALLDGATPQSPILSPELNAARVLASDSGSALLQRLEAFEDIVDSDVGDTSLNRARNLEREIGLRQIYLKFDGGNPTGTQKDRIAFAQAMDALRRGFDAVTVATCGNYGAAMALAASVSGLRCFVYVPAACHTRRMAEMEGYGADILTVDGGYEEAVQRSRDHAAGEEIYDANPGGDNTSIQLKAYGEIAVEIYDELRDAPAAVAVPVSNGTTLAGIHRGFVSLYRRGKTSRIPRMIAGSSPAQNPILLAYMREAARCDDIEPDRVRETRTNEALVNWHSIDGDHALQAIRGTGGFAESVPDRALIAWARKIRESEGLDVLPASTAGLAAFARRHERERFGPDRYVIVLTGRRR
jgi:threonine synthase